MSKGRGATAIREQGTLIGSSFQCQQAAQGLQSKGTVHNYFETIVHHVSILTKYSLFCELFVDTVYRRLAQVPTF